MNRSYQFLVIFYFLFFFNLCLQAQSIYDYSSSLKFSKWLFQTRHYDEYLIEMKDLVRKFPKEEEPKKLIIQYYWYVEKSDSVLSYYKKYFSLDTIQKEYYINNYVLALIFTKNFNEASQIIESPSNLSSNEVENLKLSLLIAEKKWNVVKDKFKNNIGNENFFAIKKEILKNRKNPVISGMFSCLLPGAGKVYAGRWQDGLVSFVFVSLFASQSYIGFHQKGLQSVFGWVNGGMALAFYSGNIYGSYKAAKIYNKNIDDKISDMHYRIYNSEY